MLPNKLENIPLISSGFGIKALSSSVLGSAPTILPVIFLLDDNVVVEYDSTTLAESLAIFSSFATVSAE